MNLRDEKTDVHLRITLPSGVRLGPGKARLLQGIKETGSIASAGRRMGMSYKRAWTLVEVMNEHFRSPMVEATKGGRSGGGAKLTPLGEEVLTTFKEMERLTRKAITPALLRLQRGLGHSR